MKKSYLLLLTLLSYTLSFGQNTSGNQQTNSKTKSESNLKKLEPIHSQSIKTTLDTQKEQPNTGQHFCKSHELTEKHYQERGVWDQFNADYYDATKKMKVPPSMKTPGVNTISVIFHVVYNPNNPAENVSNALIMQVFNDIQQDYQLLNANAANARAGFGFIPADANINFCLATKTAAGVPLAEVGVVRVSTTEDFYDINAAVSEENKMKASATGGSQIWNRNNYLNVWICDISNGANSGTAGYAYRPTTTFLPSASIDGIVLDYNLGMNNENVLTHEIGHYLGLDHTWGGSGTCTNDDGFTDTPNTAGPSFNYAGTCSGNQSTCSGVQTQYENYMDYSNCTVMFTQNQSDFMLIILSGIRNSLLASPGCDPVNAPPVADFNADLGSPIIIPVGGAVNFFDLSTNVPTAWTWNFGGGAANQTVQNPTTIFNTIGTYTVTLTASNAFGSDGEIKVGYVQVVAPAAGTACDTLRNYNPITEDQAYYQWNPTSWGYFPGTGKISGGTVPITQYGDRYTAPASTQIRRLRFPIYIAANNSGAGFMKIRVHGETAGSPTANASALVVDTFLISDMQAGYINEFDFTNPVTVTGVFWISFELFYGSPQDTIALGCVDLANRATVGVNTMKAFYSAAWHLPSDFMGAPNKTSLWLDVLTSNGPAPTADFSFSDSELCAGGQVSVNGSSSTNTTNYYWYVTDATGTIIYTQSNAAANNFSFPIAASRRIYLFADGSCKTDGIYLPITVDAVPAATVVATNTTCGNNNGTITFSSPTGGNTPNYSYSIDGVNYQASGTFTNLAPGTYTCSVMTPGDNCTKNYTRTINASTELVATVSPSTTICSGDPATITATGGTGWTWYDGSTVIGSTASLTVNPTATVQYTCIVTDGTCQATVYTYVTVDVCGSIEELSTSVKIYPNPTTDQFTIELPGSFKYTLFDSRGRLIIDGEAANTANLSSQNCEAGIYFVRISNDYFQNTYRIIKK